MISAIAKVRRSRRCFAPCLPRVEGGGSRSETEGLYRIATFKRRRDTPQPTRGCLFAQKYAFASGSPMIAPYGQNEGVISSRRRATIPLRSGSSRAPTPTKGASGNVSKRRVAEAKSARAVFALVTSGSSRYALLHASLVFVLRHAEVPGGWLAKRDGGIVPNGYIQKAKIPFHLPVR